MPDPGLFDLVLKAFTSVFSLAWTGLTPRVLWLASQLSVWCLIPAMLLAIAGLQSAIPPMLQGVIRVAFIVWVISNLHTLTNRVADWVVTIGLFIGSKMMTLVGAKPMSLADFMSPGRVLFTGFDMMLPVMKYVENLSWWNAGAILLYDFFLVIPLWFCFVVVAGALSGIIASAVRLGALAFVTGIILPLTFYLTIPLDGKDPKYWNIMAAGAMAVLLGFMAIFAPRYASTFFGGAPAFTGSTLVTAAVGVAAGGMRGVQRWMRS
jgi:type IV secretory pathway TrbL component